MGVKRGRGPGGPGGGGFPGAEVEHGADAPAVCAVLRDGPGVDGARAGGGSREGGWREEELIKADVLSSMSGRSRTEGRKVQRV